MYEDFAGLLRHHRTARLRPVGSRLCCGMSLATFTLRNLGSQLEDWLRRNPLYAGSKLTMALDMVRLEWAHIEAYDGKSDPRTRPRGSDRAWPRDAPRLAALHPPARAAISGGTICGYASNAAAEEHGDASNAVLKIKSAAWCASSAA